MIRSIWLTARAIPPNLKRMVTPLDFLRLKNRNLLVFQWIVPSVMAVAIFALCRSDLFVFSHLEVMKSVNNLMAALVGFYIAALAATATFPNNTLDKQLSGSPTTLRVKRGGAIVREEITRRRYMTIIFGYCSLLSLAVFLMGLVQTNVKVRLLDYALVKINGILFQAVWALYIWLFSSLICATLVGLHYLTDRMHRA